MEQPAARDSRPAAPEVSVKSPRDSAQRAGATAQRAGASLVGKARSVNQRQVRAFALLGSAGLWLLSLVLAPFGVVAWWAPVLMIVVVAGVVAWLRSAAMKERATSHTRPQTVPRAKVRSSAPASAQVPASVQRSAARPVSVAAGEGASRPAASSVAAAATIAAPNVEVFDIAAGDPQADHQVAMTAETQTSAPAAADGWSPVAVPRPTYTMKAKAERVEAAPAATTPTSYEHVAIEDLPFDGLALDEDVDVPEHFRAG